MSRTPSLDRESAESMLGARGSLTVTIDNRSLVRKWLVACGVPASFVGTLPLAKLAMCYNDASDGWISQMILESGSLKESDFPARPETPKSDDNAQVAQAISAAVMQALAANAKPSVDADAVRAIIRAELPSLIPVTRVEIIEDAIPRNLPEKARHKQFAEALTVVSQGVNLALVGPAGSGKTTVCDQIAEALELPFYMLGAVSGAHEFLGYVDAHGRYQSTPFRQAYEHGGLFLADEIDAGDPAGTLVINSALANGHQAFPDQVEPVKKHPKFRMVAAANTFGNGADRIYVGRNPLDGATLDRFYFIAWDYDEKLERMIAGNDSWVDRVQALRKGAASEKARIVISPRASINGAKLIAAGLSRDQVEQALIWKNTDQPLRDRINAAAR